MRRLLVLVKDDLLHRIPSLYKFHIYITQFHITRIVCIQCPRVLDMSHSLVQQTKEKHRQSFGIVKERIVNTQPCSVIEEVQQGGQCGGGLSLCGPKISKVQYQD